MNCEYVYGYPFYTFTVPEKIIDEVSQDAEKNTYEEVRIDDESKHLPSFAGHIVNEKNEKSCYYHSELYRYLDDCLSPIYDKHFRESKNHKICDLWFTKSMMGGQSTYHCHRHSIFSGLIYLHDSKTSTLFKFEDQIQNFWGKFVDVKSCDSELVYESKAVKGKLIIWPSMLYHKIAIHREKNTRYTIAFNSFWEGSFSRGHTQHLNIQTLSAKDAIVVT